MDITITCKSAYISPSSNRMVEVEIADVEPKDVLANLDARDATDYFDHEDLLKNISVDTVKKYFGLIDE